MNKQIIIINGTGGSGKDTFVEYCSKYTNVRNFSSVDKVKEIAKLIGWQGKKEDKDRKFLSDLKRLTAQYNDMPFNSMVEVVNDFRNSNDELLFLHIREPEEIERAVLEFDAISLLVKRKGLNNNTSNISDANVDNYTYDYVINNDSLESLEFSAKDFVNNISINKKRTRIKW